MDSGSPTFKSPEAEEGFSPKWNRSYFGEIKPEQTGDDIATELLDVYQESQSGKYERLNDAGNHLTSDLYDKLLLVR